MWIMHLLFHSKSDSMDPPPFAFLSNPLPVSSYGLTNNPISLCGIFNQYFLITCFCGGGGSIKDIFQKLANGVHLSYLYWLNIRFVM